MGIWDSYRERLTLSNGESHRDRIINNAKRDFELYASNSPSFREVLVNDKKQNLLICKSKTNATKKEIYSMPNESINTGDYVFFANKYWIVDFTDLDSEIYTTGSIVVCNKVLKWQNDNGDIIERKTNCVKADKNSLNEEKLITTYDGTLIATLPYDIDTCKIDVGKRFLIETIDKKIKAYKIVSVDYISNVLDEIGIVKWNLEQDEYNESTDNPILMIANYIDNNLNNSKDDEILSSEDYICEIDFNGKPELRIGGSYKTFKPVFYNNLGEIDLSIKPNWDIEVSDENKDFVITSNIEDNFKIKLTDDMPLGELIKVILSDNETNYYTEIVVRAVM